MTGVRMSGKEPLSGKEKPDAWMPLYIGDWDTATRQLTCEEDGAYGRLVRHYWRNGAPADDDAQLARIVGMDRRGWRRLRPVLEGFFDVRDGRWFHARVERELVLWTEKRRRAMERAAAGGRAKAAQFEAAKRAAEPSDAAAATGSGEANVAATSTQQALLEHCTSASASASAAGDRTPLQGVLSPRAVATLAEPHRPPREREAHDGGVAGTGNRDGRQPSPRHAWPPSGPPVGTAASGKTKTAKSLSGKKFSGGVSPGDTPPGDTPWRGVSPPRGGWTGPPEIRDHVVALRGEAYAVSYLDPSVWRPGDDTHPRQIIPRTGAAAERLRRDLRELLEGIGVGVAERAA